MGRTVAGLATVTIAARRLQKAVKENKKDTAKLWTDEIENIFFSDSPCIKAMWKNISEENKSKLQCAMSRAVLGNRTRGAGESDNALFEEFANVAAELEKKFGGRAGQG